MMQPLGLASNWFSQHGSSGDQGLDAVSVPGRDPLAFSVSLEALRPLAQHHASLGLAVLPGPPVCRSTAQVAWP